MGSFLILKVFSFQMLKVNHLSKRGKERKRRKNFKMLLMLFLLQRDFAWNVPRIFLEVDDELVSW